MMKQVLIAAVFAFVYGTLAPPAKAQTCVEAGCAGICGPGYIQINGQCLHVTETGNRCVSESFRAKLPGPSRTVGTSCTAKNDEGESYNGVVGK